MKTDQEIFQKKLKNVLKLNGMVVIQSENQLFKQKYQQMLQLEQKVEEQFSTYSQSCTFHVDNDNDFIIITSGFLVSSMIKNKSQSGMVLGQKNLSQIKNSITFHLLYEDQSNNDNDTYIPLELVRLATDKLLYDQLLKLNLDPSVGMLLFLTPQVKQDLDPLLQKTKFKQIYSHQIPQQAQKLLTISSPFGILSSELYKNCLRQGTVSKVFVLEDNQKALLLLDLITNLGQEGGGVYDENLCLSGMLLPKIQLSSHNNVYYSLALSWPMIEQIYKNQREEYKSKLFQSSQGLQTPMEYFELDTKKFESSCILIGQNYASGTLITNNRDVYVVSVKHFLQSHEQKVKVQINGNHYEAQIIYPNTSDTDFMIFKILGDLKNLISKCICIDEILNQPDIIQGEDVFTTGYGLLDLKHHDMSLISRGKVSKVIRHPKSQENLLIQTDCFVHNGYSGGGLYNSDGCLIGFQVFNIKSPSLGVLCDINFAYPLSLFKTIFQDLSKGTFSEQSKQEFESKDPYFSSLLTLQTRLQVPIFQPKL